ncbi:outer membrane protein [Erythrobacter sp. THAF29]|uniref:outer membrane protein n=1 Tax=Erythrobacter sp. THAF29 TaxID=2587851 RepID=UPI0012692EBE|nr:porin family protein [Erythrobacter sp. THAF29]QFT75941.1 hypothetical protein FIU90_00160 [Erythrobacter sp. THAF29]
MHKVTLLAAAAAATFATPAFAQDAGDADNGGVFVGVTGGYDVINLEVGNTDADDNGVVYGLTAGYDVDTGKAILGVEAEVSDTSISDNVGDAGVDIYGGVRLGYEMDDNDIIYLKAGYTNVDIDLPDNLEGVRVGGGFEHNFGGFFGRFEYRYSTYNVSDVIAEEVNGNRHQAVFTLGAKF